MGEVRGRTSVQSSLPLSELYNRDENEEGGFPWCHRKEIFLKLSVFQQPQCLVSLDEAGGIVLHEEIVKEIETIDVSLSIVAIAGLYRTGKSYLMNRLAGTSTGFSLGHSVNSHTKGIWVWCVIHPNESKQVMMLLDTEGLADPKKIDMDYDQKIFSLTVLLSSTLIYNTKGVFDSDAIEKLSFITKLSSNIQSFKVDNLSEQENKEMIARISPTFILCLRDFYLLDIEDEDKETMTADKYLEVCLNNGGKPTETTECIQKYFPNRKCFEICMPVKLKKLKSLATLKDETLDEDFIEDMNALKVYVYACKPKRLLSQTCFDGLVFGEVIKTYVDAIRRGLKLNVEEAVCNASVKNNNTSVKRVTEWFQNEISLIVLPIGKKEELQSKFFEIHNSMIRKYRQSSFLSGQKFEDLLIAQLKSEWEKLRYKNTESIQAICRAKLETLHSEIMRKEDYYSTEGGYNIFKKDLGYLEVNFYSQMKDYDRDEFEHALHVYKDSMKETKMEIYRRKEMIKERKQKEHMEEQLEKRLQEKYAELERQKDQYLQNEKRQLLDSLIAQNEANTNVLQGALEEINKKNCVIS